MYTSHIFSLGINVCIIPTSQYPNPLTFRVHISIKKREFGVYFHLELTYLRNGKLGQVFWQGFREILR